MKDNRRILNAKLQGRNGHSQSEQKRQNNCVNRLVFYTDYTDRYGQLADMKTYIYMYIYIYIESHEVVCPCIFVIMDGGPICTDFAKLQSCSTSTVWGTLFVLYAVVKEGLCTTARSCGIGHLPRNVVS